MTKKLGNFRLGRKLVRIWSFSINNHNRKRFSLRLNFRPKLQTAVTRTLDRWSRRIKRRLRNGGEYYRLCDQKQPVTPKGQLVVYVGGMMEGDLPQRYLVPVVYFNHPLFGELLREAEAEFGFRQTGGIVIPCPVSKFERVQTRIAAESR